VTGGADEPALDPHAVVVRPPRISEFGWALAGGAFAAGGVFVVAALVGRVSSFEARRLVEALKPTATFAASTYIGAGATVLALVATMVAFTITHESEFRPSFYRRIGLIARLTTVLIVTGIALLTTLAVPVAETEATATGYVTLYWGVLLLSSVGGGLTVTIVLMLNYAVRGLIALGSQGASFVTVDGVDGVAEMSEMSEMSETTV
jgi:hypothetical protein